MSADGTVVQVEGLEKTFTLHTQGGVSVPVLEGLDFAARAGECVALFGPSGSGKSTLLRCLYANYRPQAGKILVRHGDHVVDMVAAELRTVLEVRRWTIGYVSQFLRVIPRVSSLDIVVEPLITRGYEPDRAYEKGRALLARLGLPERLWSLAPATFSGGEAATHQRRPLRCRRLSRSPPRRADSIAGRHQPPRHRRADTIGKEAGRGGRGDFS